MNFYDNATLQDSLLTTKLYIPRSRAARNLVSRPRLMARLDESLKCALTLVSAPPGFGKTTLLSEWASGRLEIGDSKTDRAETTPSLISNNQPPRFAWLSLDKDDNDPARFVRYLVAALQIVEPGVGAGPLATPQDRASASPGESGWMTAALTKLINEIRPARAELMLILDDYHLIETQAIHEFLTFLLDHMPPPLHLVIASRTETLLPLARLRARGHLLELRTDDLRFTAEEAAIFLNQVMRLNLSAGDIATLETRTEGWIAGLQMAALSMQDRHDIPHFIATFTGSHRYILDYLAEEVLQKLSEPIQKFLLQTSILSRLNASLCDAVLGTGADPALNLWHGEQTSNGEEISASASQPPNSPAQKSLEYLEQANLFIIPLDDERHWYRYHHLFADFLRERLKRQVGIQGLAALHRRAAQWYEQNGLVAEATGHALAAADVERAARLIERSGRTILNRSEMATLLSWLEALPEELVKTRPRLSLFHAWALVLTGQLDTAEAQLREFRLPISEAGQLDFGVDHPTGVSEIEGEMAAIEATLAYFRRDIARAIDLYRQAFERLPQENRFLRGAVAMSLATAYHLNRDLAGAIWAFTQAKRISAARHDFNTALIAGWNLAHLHIEQGQLHHAADFYRQALQLMGQQTEQDGLFHIAGRVYVGLARVLYQWNELAEAADHIVTGLSLGEQQGDPVALISGQLALAWVKQGQGDAAEAFDALDRAEELIQKHRLLSWRVRLAACRVHLSLRHANLDAAAKWADQAGAALSTDSTDDSAGYPDDLRRIERLARARLLIARGQTEPAPALLTPLRQAAEQEQRTGQVIEILILQALAEQARNKLPRAISLLARCLSLAEPENYVRLFVDEGAPMAELLRRTRAKGINPPYVDRLLAAYPIPAASKAAGVSGFQLIEPLSERELEILQLIETGLSNRQIAENLFLTIGTVKWHINNIYGKLGVSRRTQALARARELNLL